MSSESDAKGRRNIRFEPSPNTLAWLCISSTLPYEFKEDIVGLVVEESLGGCGVIIHWDGKFHIDDTILIKVGDLEPIRGDIRYISELKKHIYQLGIMYQDQAASD